MSNSRLTELILAPTTAEEEGEEEEEEEVESELRREVVCFQHRKSKR
jgi:hypothetical protein